MIGQEKGGEDMDWLEQWLKETLFGPRLCGIEVRVDGMITDVGRPIHDLPTAEYLVMLLNERHDLLEFATYCLWWSV